tara:strand:- start:156 stop:629 length:474 start_codon:yes stop_codon:yes gene_type:complete
MIHYRLIVGVNFPTTKPTRSLKVARSWKMTKGSKIYAYASRKDALALPLDARLEVTDLEPVIIPDHQLKSFVEAHLDARAINPKYPPSSASSRRQMENRFTFRLFGFLDGQAIDAQQFMSVSCRWVRYSCPIYINGKKRTIRALDRGSKAWTSIASH